MFTQKAMYDNSYYSHYSFFFPADRLPSVSAVVGTDWSEMAVRHFLRLYESLQCSCCGRDGLVPDGRPALSETIRVPAMQQSSIEMAA